MSEVFIIKAYFWSTADVDDGYASDMRVVQVIIGTHEYAKKIFENELENLKSQWGFCYADLDGDVIASFEND